MDGWAHNAYPTGAPTQKSRNADDVLLADMSKLTRVMAAARRAGLVSKRAAASLWMTELSWDSYPDPNGLSLRDHATYLSGAFYVLWKAGVQHVLWWNSRDAKQGTAWNASYQSGVYMRGTDPDDPNQDVAKPSLTAFRFPFTAYRTKGTATLWAKAPGSGPVTVQARRGDAWQYLATLKPAKGGTVSARVKIASGVALRAVQGAELSLEWTTS